MSSNKNIGRKINDFFSGWERIRVVLLGSKGTGKTVFMTSVGDQLRHHTDKFDLHGWSVEFDAGENDKVQERVLKTCMPVFPYAESRAYLSKGEWPAKTKDWSVLTVPFTLTKGKTRRQILLEMLDLPGERVADFAMIGRSYRQWSVWMETRFAGISGSSEGFRKYLNELAGLGDSDSDKDKAIGYYKDFLADEYSHYALSLTPSIIKLGRDGKQRTGTKEQFRKGLDDSEDLQFVPLPRECFAKDNPHVKWVKTFAMAYEEYKRSVIAPIASWCKHANSLLYFVDVLELLKRGAEVYNAEKKFAEQALGFFKRTKASNKIMSLITLVNDLFVTHIDNCYVIATKADRVCRQGDKMASLAREMVEPIVRTMRLGQEKMGYYSCASVSTSDIYEKEHAIGARVKSGKDRETGKDIIELRQFEVDEVPSSWPESDKWRRDFNWQTTFPMFDARDDNPPRQNGLDLIIRKVLAID